MFQFRLLKVILTWLFPVYYVRECNTLLITGTLIASNAFQAPVACPFHHQLLVNYGLVEARGSSRPERMIRLKTLYPCFRANPVDSVTKYIVTKSSARKPTASLWLFQWSEIESVIRLVIWS